MKRVLLILLILVVLVAWWATGSRRVLPANEPESTESAPYPADFQARLMRVTGLCLDAAAPLPEHPIPWQSAGNHPSAGHSEARKGGRVRLSNAGPFPAHFLRFGGTAVQFFHQNLHAATEIPLVARHPLTQEPTAGVAEAWAIMGHTIYFRLNPGARYNNGRPVRAADYLLATLLQAEQRCSGHEQLAAAAESLRAHGEHLLSITLREPAVDVVAVASLLLPAEPAFYQQFDSRFRETYAQRIPPATGPYRVSHVERGRLLELQRVQNWWGEALPLCHHRFNANALEYHFLTSEAQVWEFFLRGKLDALQTRNIAAWQERLNAHPELPTLVYDAEYPLPPYGIALNTLTLPDAELRRGLLQAMDMDRAVQQMQRGEGQRLRTFSSGYGKLTPASTPGYAYSPEAARSCFARAGYTITGKDGILQRPDGTRLSVTLLYSPHEKISSLLGVLVRSAARCGAEIVLEPVPWQICQRKLQARSHQLVFWAVPAPETPNPALFFAPDAAPDFAPFALDSPEMNEALARFEARPDAANLSEIDRLVHELAIWLPGWKENRVYLVHQSHLHVPASPWCFDALDAHLFWVDASAAP